MRWRLGHSGTVGGHPIADAKPDTNGDHHGHSHTNTHAARDAGDRRL
jgi:hypothetical protein